MKVKHNGKECDVPQWAIEQAYKNGYAKGYEDGTPKWIPVSEPPKKDGKYLVFQKHPYGTVIRVLWFAKDARKVNKYDFVNDWKNVWYAYSSEWGYYTIDDATYWMPLPQPPKGE